MMFKHTKNCPCKLPIKKQIQIFGPHLKKISKARSFAQKQKLFQEAPKCFTKFISSCSSAILREYIQLPDETWRKLKKHKNLLLQLSDGKISLKNKINSFLDKKGGAFPFIPILGSILANIGIPYLFDKIKNG
jgi:hypothetical protein